LTLTFELKLIYSTQLCASPDTVITTGIIFIIIIIRYIALLHRPNCRTAECPK